MPKARWIALAGALVTFALAQPPSASSQTACFASCDPTCCEYVEFACSVTTCTAVCHAAFGQNFNCDAIGCYDGVSGAWCCNVLATCRYVCKAGSETHHVDVNYNCSPKPDSQCPV